MCVSPLRLRNSDLAVSRGWPLYREVPCGCCPECVSNGQTQWSERARRELLAFRPFYKPYKVGSKSDESNMAFFFTFTYDDARLPLSFKGNPHGAPTLWYEHITDFFHHFNKKRFRQGKNAMSYLLCGEYGTKTHRPHYHCICIGLSLSDAREMREYWQKRHCPKSLQYDLANKSTADEFFKSVIFDHVNMRVGVSRFAQVGVTLSEIKLDDGAINGASRYVSKYVVKGGDDWSKNNDDVYKTKLCVTKGFGLGYRFSAPAKKILQDDARDKVLSSMKTDLFRSLPSVPMYLGENYNPSFLSLVNGRLTTHDDKGYPHLLPNFLYSKLFPNQYLYESLEFCDEYGNVTTQTRQAKLYPELCDYSSTADLSVPKTTPFVDALAIWRLAKSNERIMSLFEAWQTTYAMDNSTCSFDIFFREYEFAERQKHNQRCASLLRQCKLFYAQDKF